MGASRRMDDATKSAGCDKADRVRSALCDRDGGI
jgi:hypothetical protein